MNKHGRCLLLLFSSLLSGCLSHLWTGASLVYNRHTLYHTLNDYQLALAAQHSLFKDKLFKGDNNVLELAVFNQDVLVAGHLNSKFLRNMANKRMKKLPYRHLFMQIAIHHNYSNTLENAWITTKIRSQILADSKIDPNAFKIITVDNIVYVMGDVKPAHAKRVLLIAKKTRDVLRVVKLLNYYNLSHKSQDVD